jgi:hypothetical protein
MFVPAYESSMYAFVNDKPHQAARDMIAIAPDASTETYRFFLSVYARPRTFPAQASFRNTGPCDYCSCSYRSRARCAAATGVSPLP